MKIVELGNAIKYRSTVINWLKTEWGEMPILEYLRSYNNKILPTDTLPITFIAIEKNEAIGTI